MYVVSFLLLFLLSETSSAQEDVLFESGKKFTAIDEKLVEQDVFGDPKNTGSWLFNASVDSNDMKRLSLAVSVRRFRSISSGLFRAHPVFIKCLQLVINTMQNAETPVMLRSGYRTLKDIGHSSKPQDLYATAGTAAVLAFKPGINADLKGIASAALEHCPSIFERFQRDIGIIMMKDQVHIHMTGFEDTEPLFRSEGFMEMDTQTFQEWALTAIDSGIDPDQTPNCEKYTGLFSGETYPSDAIIAEDVVGDIDTAITRLTEEDFKTLVQYQGRNIEFSNLKNCQSDEDACIDCADRPAGNALNKRCASRLMSSRMYNKLRLLQKLVRDNMPGMTVTVVRSWDEPYSGNLGYSNMSLHTEGRQVVIRISPDNTDTHLMATTKLARCAGMDFIKHNGNEVVMAVKKSSGNEDQRVNFQGTELLSVSPPHDKAIHYKLPAKLNRHQYPLFDSHSQVDVLLADDVPLRLFLSKLSEFRYFRLSPEIARCYSLILHHYQKHLKDGDQKTTLDVTRGYISTTEQNLTIDAFDQRYNTFILGLALEVGYIENPNNVSVQQLAQTAIDKCGPVFAEADMAMGLGIYTDKVFVDIRQDFEVWGESNIYNTVLDEELNLRYKAALANRIVDPDDLGEALKSSVVPYPKSFEYRHTPSIRHNQETDTVDICIPQEDTAFCKRTETHRNDIIQSIWKELSRKWHYHDEKETFQALENCFGLCGTCMEGKIYQRKLEHCDNLLHWVNFDLMNENTTSNFFQRDDQMLRRYASMGHTLEDSEIFHLVVNAVEAVFRSDPKMSVEENVYSLTENPSPVMAILYQLYAIHAEGVAKVWIKDDTDISALRVPLKVLMLYNEKISEIEVYVSSVGSKDAVDAALQNLILEWSTTGYPPHTRDVIAPFSIRDLPKLITKRDSDFAIREQMIAEHFHRTERWMDREL